MSAVSVLVVEDEFLLACMLEDDLHSIGCTVIGPFPDVPSAMNAIRTSSFQAAILDINLNGEMSYPLADELCARGIPFLFLTGYTAFNIPERYKAFPRLAKPYDLNLLKRHLLEILG